MQTLKTTHHSLNPHVMIPAHTSWHGVDPSLLQCRYISKLILLIQTEMLFICYYTVRWTNPRRKFPMAALNLNPARNIVSTLKTRFDSHREVTVPKATPEAPTSAFKSRCSPLLSFHKSSTTNEKFLCQWFMCKWRKSHKNKHLCLSPVPVL